MADPISMIAIGGMAASAAGGIVGAIGSLTSGEANANMYNYQAGIARMNANINKQNADYARAAGEVEAQEKGMHTRYVIGEQKVAQGAGNIDVNRGSAAEVRASQHEVGLEEQGIVRSNAARKAYGYEVEAAQAEAQSNVYGMASRQSRTAGRIGAVTSILGAASSVSSKWLDYKTKFGNSSDSNSVDVGSATQMLS